MTLEEIAHLMSMGCLKKIIIDHDPEKISEDGTKKIQIYPKGTGPELGYTYTFTTGTAEEVILRDCITSFGYKNF